MSFIVLSFSWLNSSVPSSQMLWTDLRWNLYLLGTDCAQKKQLSIVACHRPSRKHSFIYYVLVHVYGGIAWNCIDQIHYNILGSLCLAPSVLTLALGGGWVVNFLSWLLYSYERARGNNWWGGLVDPQSQCRCCGVEKVLLPLLGIEPQCTLLMLWLSSFCLAWVFHFHRPLLRESSLYFKAAGLNEALVLSSA